MSMMAAPSQAQTATPAAKPAEGPVHIVTYVDIANSSSIKASEILKRYRDAARKQAANLGVDVYQEIGRVGRFAISEGWRDAKAFDANAAAEHTKQLSTALTPLQVAPPDQRRHDAYAMSPTPASTTPPAGVIVMTHVDVPPPLLAELEPLLKAVAEASRKEPGALGFNVLQQTSRKNHFTTVEAWQSVKAVDTHNSGSAARQFRDKLGPMLGALYDQRLYRPIR